MNPTPLSQAPGTQAPSNATMTPTMPPKPTNPTPEAPTQTSPNQAAIWQAARSTFAAPAFVAITRHGAQTAARARAAVAPSAPLYLPEKHAAALGNTPGVAPYAGKTADAIATLWQQHDALVAVVSLGAIVRLIAPLLADKNRDPAVVVIDDSGRFVIPVLSGHLGGANALAQAITEALGATCVLTTASDSQKSLAVDLLGRELDWRFQASHDTVVHVSAAVVNGDPVLLWQTCDHDRDWWSHHAGGRRGIPLPQHIHVRHVSPDSPFPSELANHFRALLWVGRIPPPPQVRAAFPERLIHYAPPERIDRTRVAVGVGCDRGTPAETIATALQEALARLPEPATIVHCASITLKRDESGLHEALAPHLHAGASLSFYPPEALAAIPVPSPSETVRRYTGTPSVAEAAALLAAGWRASTLAEHPGYPMLPVEKLRRRGSDGRNVTISLAYCYQPPEGTKPDGATRNASERDVYRSLCSEPR